MKAKKSVKSAPKVAVVLPETPWLGLTEEQFQRFARRCHATFQTLGCDLFSEGQSMSRAEVIEVTLDADYLRMYGYRGAAEWKEYDEIIGPWITKNYGTPKFKALMATIFKFSSYGL